MNEAINQGIAWQIRINREGRGLSQEQLAEQLRMQPSLVAGLENPDTSAHCLETLKNVARAFDCALLLKLVPFSVLAAEHDHLSPNDQFAASFTEEVSGSRQRDDSAGTA
jgi:transcriptional regulator with XRE-family HTH domain